MAAVEGWRLVEELIGWGFAHAPVAMANETDRGLARCIWTREMGVRMIRAAYEAGVPSGGEVYPPDRQVGARRGEDSQARRGLARRPQQPHSTRDSSGSSKPDRRWIVGLRKAKAALAGPG